MDNAQARPTTDIQIAIDYFSNRIAQHRAYSMAAKWDVEPQKYLDTLTTLKALGVHEIAFIRNESGTMPPDYEALDASIAEKQQAFSTMIAAYTQAVAEAEETMKPVAMGDLYKEAYRQALRDIRMLPDEAKVSREELAALFDAPEQEPDFTFEIDPEEQLGFGPSTANSEEVPPFVSEAREWLHTTPFLIAVKKIDENESSITYFSQESGNDHFAHSIEEKKIYVKSGFSAAAAHNMVSVAMLSGWPGVALPEGTTASMQDQLALYEASQLYYLQTILGGFSNGHISIDDPRLHQIMSDEHDLGAVPFEVGGKPFEIPAEVEMVRQDGQKYMITREQYLQYIDGLKAHCTDMIHAAVEERLEQTGPKSGPQSGPEGGEEPEEKPIEIVKPAGAEETQSATPATETSVAAIPSDAPVSEPVSAEAVTPVEEVKPEAAAEPIEATTAGQPVAETPQEKTNKAPEKTTLSELFAEVGGAMKRPLRAGKLPASLQTQPAADPGDDFVMARPLNTGKPMSPAEIAEHLGDRRLGGFTNVPGDGSKNTGGTRWDGTATTSSDLREIAAGLESPKQRKTGDKVRDTQPSGEVPAPGK